MHQSHTITEEDVIQYIYILEREYDDIIGVYDDYLGARNALDAEMNKLKDRKAISDYEYHYDIYEYPINKKLERGFGVERFCTWNERRYHDIRKKVKGR